MFKPLHHKCSNVLIQRQYEAANNDSKLLWMLSFWSLNILKLLAYWLQMGYSSDGENERKQSGKKERAKSQMKSRGSQKEKVIFILQFSCTSTIFRLSLSELFRNIIIMQFFSDDEWRLAPRGVNGNELRSESIMLCSVWWMETHSVVWIEMSSGYFYTISPWNVHDGGHSTFLAPWCV